MDMMLSLTLYIGCILVGFAILIWAADKFIMGAITIALYAHISPLLIGIVIVGFATSAPEYLVSILAVINGSSGLSFGNVLGSNISNIALGLGLPALFSFIIIPHTVVKNELPLLLLSTIIALFILYDSMFSRLDALLLLSIFCFIMGLSIWIARKKYKVESNQEVTPETTKGKAILWLFIGLVSLVGASQILVYGATNFATMLGVSDLVIGLTIVAVGTSLPEIASSCLAVIRGETDMAFGNIIGSNLFNLLLVLGTTGIISPTKISKEIILRDGMAMLIITILLLLFSLGRNPKITRLKGAMFILFYIGYIIILIATEKGMITL